MEFPTERRPLSHEQVLNTMRGRIAGTFVLGSLIALVSQTLGQESAHAWKSQGVIDNSKSPHAKLHSVPVSAVSIGDGFWSARIRSNVDTSLPTLLELFEQHGVVDNFRRLSGRKKVNRRGLLWTDSDLYKWMEGAAFVLQTANHAELQTKLEDLIDDVAAAQEPSGYLNTYYVEDRVSERLRWFQGSHELYCLGHLLQAGFAHYRATGSRKLLSVGIKYADYLIDNFGPDKRPIFPGHPELEMALVELYRITGDRRYLAFAGYLLGGDGGERLRLSDLEIRNLFTGIPFTSRKVLSGHAVRALYACSGATDYYMETGDPVYLKTLEILWKDKDMAERKMYLTGGVGSRSDGEAFGDPFELPNARAYAESCSSIASLMWNWRMLAVTGQARFADLIERLLYNAINADVSLSGTTYCYRSPLASRGEKYRNHWYDCTCCPPNLQRTFASLPGYFYSTSPEGVSVHLFHNSTLDWHLEDGTGLRLKQETNYPWDATVTLTLEPEQPREFALAMRIPGWSRETKVQLNGAPAEGDVQAGEYFTIRRRWRRGDKVMLVFDMKPRLTRADSRVEDNRGRVAVERGPLVYCLEQIDQVGDEAVSERLLLLTKDPGSIFASEYRPEILGGICMLKGRGIVNPGSQTENRLYRDWKRTGAESWKEVELVFTPFYAWGNRGLNSMEVWIPYSLGKE